jgi:hypothetical protein
MLAVLLASDASGVPPPPPRASRERLIFKHVAKTGGQAVISKLRAEYAPLLADGTLVIKTEQEAVRLADARESYIISSVRNPCSLYVSLWAWGVMGHGRYNRLFKQAHHHDPAMAHVFDSVDNASAFGAFARASLGEFSRRYRDFLELEAVDCWVHTEDLDKDLDRCLSRFNDQAPPAIAERMRAAGARGGRGAARTLSGGDGAWFGGGSESQNGNGGASVYSATDASIHGGGIHGGGIHSGDHESNSGVLSTAPSRSSDSRTEANPEIMLNSTLVHTAVAAEPIAAPAQYRWGEERLAEYRWEEEGLAEYRWGGEGLSQHRRRASSANEYNVHESQHAPCGWYFAEDPELIRLIAKVHASHWAIKGAVNRGKEADRSYCQSPFSRGLKRKSCEYGGLIGVAVSTRRELVGPSHDLSQRVTKRRAVCPRPGA